jgi:hypothetical protein
MLLINKHLKSCMYSLNLFAMAWYVDILSYSRVKLTLLLPNVCLA